VQKWRKRTNVSDAPMGPKATYSTVLARCERNGIDYVFGQPGNKALHADPVIVACADACATDRALGLASSGPGVLRRFAETRCAAKSWGLTKCRVVARIEASSLGLDIRRSAPPDVRRPMIARSPRYFAPVSA
jgi:hypothetical protein